MNQKKGVPRTQFLPTRSTPSYAYVAQPQQISRHNRWAGSDREQVQVCPGARLLGTQARRRGDPVSARRPDTPGGHQGQRGDQSFGDVLRHAQEGPRQGVLRV